MMNCGDRFAVMRVVLGINELCGLDTYVATLGHCGRKCPLNSMNSRRLPSLLEHGKQDEYWLLLVSVCSE